MFIYLRFTAISLTSPPNYLSNSEIKSNETWKNYPGCKEFFFVNLKSNLVKSKGGRNLIPLANNLVGQRQKFTGKISAQKWPDFLCLFDFQIVSPVNQSYWVFKINKQHSLCKDLKSLSLTVRKKTFIEYYCTFLVYL